VRRGGNRVRRRVEDHFAPLRAARVQHRGPALTLDDLARAGEAIVRTALAAAR